MAEVVLDPAALDDFAAITRRRLLAIDTGGYDGALATFAATRNDVGGGDPTSLTPRLRDTLGELERVNRSCEAFVDAMSSLDRRSAGGGVIRASMSAAEFAEMVGQWQRLFRGDVLAAAEAIQVVQSLEDELAGLSDPTLSADERAAADARVLGLLDDLIDMGVNDDPAMQVAVVTALGADGVEAFAARLAVVERDAGGPVPWAKAGMELMAGWTASAANSYDVEQLDGFLEAMPAELITALNLLAPWSGRAGAQAAANVWARPGVGRGEPVVPALVAPRGWPAPEGNVDLAAMILATNHAAAFELLTEEVTILASMVAGTVHPAATAAVTAGLISHPRGMFVHGDVSGVPASADAFAALMDHEATVGASGLTVEGRGALERVAGFHFDLMDQGVRPAADAFLDGAGGTFSPVVDDFLRDALADNPNAVAAVATHMDATDLGRLIATLADPEVDADGAVVVVGEEVTVRLARVGAQGKAVFLHEMGPDGLADLSSAAVGLGSNEVLDGLGVGYADALTAMSPADQVAWLDLMAAADDRAGYAAVLLSHSDGLPGTMLPVFLSQESATFLVPHSDGVRAHLNDVTGDWVAWSTDLYATMMADHHGPFTVVVRALQGDFGVVEPAGFGAGGEAPAGRLSTGSVSPGFSTAFGTHLIDNPLALDETLQRLGEQRSDARSTVLGVMSILAQSNRQQEVIDAYAGTRLAGSFSAHGHLFDGQELAQPQAHMIRGAFGDSGERIGALQKAASPSGMHVDLASLSRLFLVEVTDDVPFVGRATRYADNAWTVAESVTTPTDDDYDAASRARTYESLDFLTDASPRRGLILRSFGFEMDGDRIMASPTPALDPFTTVEDYPHLRTLLEAADAFGDGLDTGRSWR